MTVCVTNFLPDVSPCTVRDQHKDSCDGVGERWTEDGLVATGKPCRGCLPRPATHGYVCTPCYESVVSGLAGAPRFFGMLHGVERAITPSGDGRSSSSLGYVPLGGLALAREELDSFGWRGRSADEWVSTMDGAASAVRFGRAMKAALRSHPYQEEPHDLKRTHCPECGRLTMVWHPASAAGEKVIVKCRDPKCGHQVPEDKLDDVSYIESLSSPKRTRAA